MSVHILQVFPEAFNGCRGCSSEAATTICANAEMREDASNHDVADDDKCFEESVNNLRDIFPAQVQRNRFSRHPTFRLLVEEYDDMQDHDHENEATHSVKAECCRIGGLDDHEHGHVEG